MSTIYHRELSDKVIGLAFNVHRTLGCGLLEACYEGAMCVELTRAGIPFERQHVFPLVYMGEYIGAYIADLVVADTLIRSARMRQSRECQGWQKALILSSLIQILKRAFPTIWG
jgi:GxxExxY protein